MPFFVGGDIPKKPLLPCRGRIYVARGLSVSSRPPYTAGPGMPGPYACSNAKTG